MANIAIFRINYKSDFILTLNSDAGWLTPFCIKFWTGAPSQAYFAGYDGTTYTHCAPVDGEPTKLLVQFDDHHLPIGDLKCQIAYHFTVADFPTSVEDEVLNQASVIIEVNDAPAQVMLDLNGETAPEIEFSLPAYANEAQRIANEEDRIAAEQQRIANEESRIGAEETRQRNEQQRIEQETARVHEFATLKSQSQAATRNANDAATLANQKAQLAADKAALADDAATLATQKAQLAADKAALANDAAQLANEKAALAQQKAEYAQQQGSYAKDQGDYAKDQGDYAKAQGDIAQSDHERAETDHGIAADDHTQAGNDHTRAEADHGIAANDHTQAGNDHTRAEADHGIAANDHTQAGNDHTRAEADHGIAADDHTQAGNDHTRAESDHTRAESDHAAVEVYVDSLGAFDISAYHATGGVLAKYADLTAALGTNGANIPDALRKGGMSVKFVLSSDNKYLQYRYMSSSTAAADFTNVANWQGVDDEPTLGSQNLVKSGGVVEIIKKSINISEHLLSTHTGAYVKPNGNPGSLDYYIYIIYDISNIQEVNIKFDGVYLGDAIIWATYSQLDNNDISSSYLINKKVWPDSLVGQPCDEKIFVSSNEKFLVVSNRISNYQYNKIFGYIIPNIPQEIATISQEIATISQKVLDIRTLTVDASIIDYNPAGTIEVAGAYYTAVRSRTFPDREKDGILKEIRILHPNSSDVPFSIKLYKKEWVDGVITRFTEIAGSTYTFTFPSGESVLNVLSRNIVIPKDAIIGINTAAHYADSAPVGLGGIMVVNGAFSTTFEGSFLLDVDYIVQFSGNDSSRLLEDEQRITALEEQYQESVFDAIKDANVVILGDSITWLGGDDCNGRDNPSKGWTTYFKALLNPKTIHSYARSGATWSHTANTVYNITENTGSLSDDNVIYNQINRLVAAVSGGTQVVPDIIIIAAGTNDAWYPSARPDALSVDADTEFADTSEYITDAAVGTLTSIAASMRYDIELIKTNYPNCQVFVTTPLQATAFTQARCFNVGKIISDCAKYLAIECVDQGAKAGIYRAQENEQYMFTYDGTHTSVLGAKMVGRFLAYEIMCKYRGTLN